MVAVSHTKKARNDRIARLRETGMSFRKIAERIAIEFPEDDPTKNIKRNRVRDIYRRDVLGIEEPGTLFRKKQREAAK
tara:strand:- start:705 stop:938 length:234 start_codon:yes stop_codon:yes gene_type:complete